jgi:hypothetical protein
MLSGVRRARVEPHPHTGVGNAFHAETRRHGEAGGAPPGVATVSAACENQRHPHVTTRSDEPGSHADVVVTNPPFGKKSSITIVNEEGDTDRQTLTYKL